MTATGRAALVAAVSTTLVLAVASRAHQGIYSDPAYQVKAVQQTLGGASPNINTLLAPDADDLSRDRGEQLSWWAPGTQLAAEPLMKAGLPVAAAARAIAFAALLAGAIGWMRWFGLFPLPTAAIAALAALVPWMRHASNALFQYTSEILVFAAVPWVLLAALAAERRASAARWFMTGVLAGSLYIVKYSASFVAVGILGWMARRVWLDRGRGSGALAAAAAGTAIPVAVLTAINRDGGSANLLTASLLVRPDWTHAVHAVALPALAASDLDAVLRFLLMHPSRPVVDDVIWLSVLGLPGGVLLVWLALRGGVAGSPAALARAVFATTLVAIGAVWTVSNGVSVEARHVFSAAFCMLPLALAEGLTAWRGAARSTRVALASACAAYVVLPLAYGPMSVSAKAWRYPSDFRPAASGLYNPLFAERDLDGVVDRLERDFDPAADVWYLTEPISALDLKGRAIIRDSDFLNLDELRRDRFQTSRPVRVHVLLPPRFEANGKGDVIRSSFPQAVGWRRDAIPGSQYDRWTADLRPGGAY